jgi:hypothetical protein
MKKTPGIFGLFFLILLLPVLSAGCGPTLPSAALGEQFMLYAGKTYVISGENLKIQFVEVISDGRCPYGTECVQAGEARCQMQITYHESTTSLTFIQQGTDNITVDFEAYQFTFQLQPYPVYGDQISKHDYRLKMKVTR